MFFRILWTICLLLVAVPAAAEVEVHVQNIDLDSSASSSCAEDPDPEPDAATFDSSDLAPVDESLESMMISACGEAGSEVSLQLTYEPNAIAGVLVVTSTLDSLGFATASGAVTVQIRAATPSTWQLVATADVATDGEADFGTNQVGFAGFSDGSSGDVSVDWSGSLVADETAVLEISAMTGRDVRWILDTPIIREGMTSRTVTFRIEFGELVTPTLPASMARLKARF